MAKIKGTAANETITGGTGNDFLYGMAGNDTVSGGTGNDYVDGGAGNDNLSGGDGKDRVQGGAGNDTATGGIGDDYVDGSIGNDTVSGNEGNDTVLGGLGDDLVYGNDGNDTVSGGAGNDTVDGGAGNDTITGGAGNDTMVGGTGFDLIIAGGIGTDSSTGGAEVTTTDLTTTYFVGGDTLSFADATTKVYLDADDGVGVAGTGSAGDSWAGIENYTGSNGDDAFIASDTVNGIYHGGAGDDQIGSGAALELMYGDAGNDFLFGDASFVNKDLFGAQYGQGADRFENFDSHIDSIGDRIVVSNKEFNLNGTTTAVLNSSAFESGTSYLATTANTRFIYETDTHILWADKDGSGTAFHSVAIAIIDSIGTLNSPTALASTHFDVIA